MYSTLTAQHLQLGALEAAAKAALAPEDFDIFSAAMAVSNSVQTPRNHLAHWVWGGCRQRPDLLVLANPKMLHERDFKVAKTLHSLPSPTEADPLQIGKMHFFDDSQILAYSDADLQRGLSDLQECYFILVRLSTYLDPALAEHLSHNLPALKVTREEIRATIPQQLNEKRLFREALARIHAARKSTPPKPHV
jgi:hypothetical protein